MKNIADFQKAKSNNEKLTMMTAYDYPAAKLVEQANTDMILVGDSLGMVVLGYESTIFVSLADMVHHLKAVRRGAMNTFIIGDMPFASYHGSNDRLIENAAQLMQEGGANAVKVEGNCSEAVALLTKIGIPVVAHLGLTPQSVGVLGGYKVQAKTENEADKLIKAALEMERAGAVMLVVECVPETVAKKLTEKLKIPTIGIGAGKYTDGQVLVYHDVLQYGVTRLPKFVKAYCDLNEVILTGLIKFNTDVKNNHFPEAKHTFGINK